MAHYLQMPKKQQVLALLDLGWSYRRIQAETGVHRDTVSSYDAARRANPTKTCPGSETSVAAPSHKSYRLRQRVSAVEAPA